MQGPRAHLAVSAALLLAVAGLPSASSASSGTRAANGPMKYAVLDGCGAADRLCMAFPDDCSANNTCTLAVTVRPDPSDPDKYLFEMAAQFHAYVAVALAEAPSMGEDSVVECIYSPAEGKVLEYQSLNHPRNSETEKRRNTRLPPEEQVGVLLLKGALQDEVISCTFRRDRETKVRGRTYDLAAGSWILQASAGNTLHNDTTIHHHIEWVVSGEEKVKLSTTGLLKTSHGSRRDPDPSPNGAPASAAFSSTGVLALTLASLATIHAW